MNKKVILTDKLKPMFSSEGPYSHWFGYYNYSPMSADGKKLLAHKVDFDGRNILPEDTAEIGFYTLADGVWHPLAVTHAINWQQGAMLQWLGPDFNDRIVFNDVEGEHFVSRIYDVTSGTHERTIPFPIYGVSPDGKFSITLQFERSYWCRAYHYESIRNTEWNVPIPKEDGIFRVDLVTGEVKRIISIEDIVSRLKSGESDGTESHWVEHIMLNPSGTRFIFYHRYGHGYTFNTLAYIADADGDELERIRCEGNMTFSHVGWRGDGQFIVYCYAKTNVVSKYSKAIKSRQIGARLIVGFIRNVIKKILPSTIVKAAKGAAFYVMVNTEHGMVSKLPITQLPDDGHPSFTKDGRYMLTDTYADKEGYRHLMLYDMERQKTILLGKFHSPFNCCGYRADLHPRFSRDEKKVIIDSAHTGRHQIYVFDVKWEKIKV